MAPTTTKRRGRGRPAGPGKHYNKVLRRQGDIANQERIISRLGSKEERAFVVEASVLESKTGSRRISLGEFAARAMLERAEKVLGRLRPQLPA